MSNNKISLVCYANDSALIAESEDDLERQFFKYYQACHQLNMSILTENTKSITIAKDPIRCKLVVGGKSIQQLTQLKYLGVDLSSDHDPVRDLRELINKAAVISGCLRGVVWSKQYMRTETKVKIYKICIRPTQKICYVPSK